MIPLKRQRTPENVPKNFRGDTPRERLVELMKLQREIERGTKDKHEFPSKWGEAKPQLQKETKGKCAYCEASTTESMHGDVEHYRPKSEYWWLAYAYENYLASCQLCNQKYKKALFEVAGDSIPLTEPAISAATTDEEIEELAKSAIPDPLDQASVLEYERAHRAEKPLILNPYIDDPATVLAWQPRDGIKEVDLVSNPANPDAPAYVDAAVRLLGLNRPELRERRYSVYSNYKLFAEMRDHADLPGDLRERAAVQIKNNFVDAENPYAGMIRYFEAKIQN